MLNRFLAPVLGGILLSSLVGCSLDSFSFSFSSKPQMEQVFNGPLAVVSMMMQQTLTDYHIKYTNTATDADTVRLIGTTVTDDPFTLTLKKVKGDLGEKTQAKIEWEKHPNEEFWTNLVGATIKNLNSLGGGPGVGQGASPFGTPGSIDKEMTGGLPGLGMGRNSMREPPGPITPEERQQIFGIR